MWSSCDKGHFFLFCPSVYISQLKFLVMVYHYDRTETYFLIDHNAIHCDTENISKWGVFVMHPSYTLHVTFKAYFWLFLGFHFFHTALISIYGIDLVKCIDKLHLLWNILHCILNTRIKCWNTKCSVLYSKLSILSWKAVCSKECHRNKIGSDIMLNHYLSMVRIWLSNDHSNSDFFSR